MEYTNKEFIAIKFYKAERWCYTHNLKLFAKIIYHLMQILLGCTIPYSALLEEGVNIAHFHGIVIHQNSKIGAKTIIYQNVCIGGRNGSGGAIIGQNCILGAGSCVLGNIKIGNNVKIGANAVVLKDIPDNCTAVGVPAQIVNTKEVK